MPVYTTFVVNSMLCLSVTPPADETDGFRLETELKPTMKPFSIFPPRSRASMLSELADLARGRSYDGTTAEAITITEPQTAHRFVALLARHHFLRPDDLIALHRTIGAWLEPASADDEEDLRELDA